MGHSGKIFGIGLSKTGTSSLTEALNLLGIRSVHFPHDERTFDELRRGQYRLSILDEYRSVTDTPVAPFYAQLDGAWPGSKFILTVREKSSWLRSAESHWRRLKEGPRADDERFQAFADFINACVYGCVHFEAERFSFVYDRHVRAVREHFASRPEDLLVMDICGGDGWEKLCPFIGVPTPDGVPFPHANSGRHWAARQSRQAEWERLTSEVGEELSTALPHGSTVIFVDQDRMRTSLNGKLRLLPFRERDGEYGGLPEDDAAAIAELERLKHESGASFLAVAPPCRWLMDEYPGFAEHVRSRYACIRADERMLVHDLRIS